MTPAPLPDEYTPHPLSAEEYGRGEITRWLQRVERAIGDLKNEVVSRGVYEVERREMERDIVELREQVTAHRAELNAQAVANRAELLVIIERDRGAAQLRHERMVNRAWWLIATLAALALSVVGLFLKTNGG